MKRHLIVRVVSLVLVFAILLQTPALVRQSEGTIERWLDGLNQPVQAEDLPGASLTSQTMPQLLNDASQPAPKAETAAVTLFAPAVRTPLGPPDFEIIAPTGDWTVSGTLFFAVQARVPRSVSSVTFLAGSTTLGTDNTPDDGYQVFLDAGAFPAGPLTLTAQASGPAGQASQSVTVNVVSNPPASGVIGSSGGVLASEIGSTITFPPGALPDGTTVAVDELTQAEVTAQNGINWESLGVTFLGAQEVQAGSAGALPFRVSSAGFGNKVQPGQTVVNYRLIPDADGDGVDEIVVVNTASVAPNDDVISDPVPQILLRPTVTVAGKGRAYVQELDDGITGITGTAVKIQSTGLNPASLQGNVGVWTSLVDGQVYALPGVVFPDPVDSTLQVFTTVIPPLPAGGASLVIHNQSTGSATAVIDVTIEPAPPLSQPAKEIISGFLVDSITYLETVPASSPEQVAVINESILHLTQAHANFTQLFDQEVPLGLIQPLNDIALMVENFSFDIVKLGQGENRIPNTEAEFQLYLAWVGSLATLLSGLSFFFPVLAPAAGALRIVSGILGTGYVICLLFGNGTCIGGNQLTSKAQACLPSASAGGAGVVAIGSTPPPQAIGAGSDVLNAEPPVIFGMGAAAPPGGNVCGNAAVPLETSPGGVRSSAATNPGRFVVKVISGGNFIPFTGLTDAGGYFFIPLVPAGQTFTAIALDTETSDVRTFEEVGPPAGESALLFFDFIGEENSGTPIEFGDVVAGQIASPGEIDIFTFDGNANDKVLVRTIDVPNSSSFSSQLSILRPDATVLCTDNSNSQTELLCPLDSTGTFILHVGEYPGNSIGDYVLYLQRTNNPANPTPINFDNLNSGSITDYVEMDAYTFTGATNDRVIVRASDIPDIGLFNPEFRIYRPNGTLLCSKFSYGLTELDCTLDTTGAYTLLFGEYQFDSNAAYDIYIQRLINPANATPINLGDTVNGAITSNILPDAYTLSGTTGAPVLYRVTETSGTTLFNPEFRVYRPNGTLLCDDYGASLAEEVCVFDGSGLHTVLVVDGSGNGTGSYTIHVEAAP